MGMFVIYSLDGLTIRMMAFTVIKFVGGSRICYLDIPLFAYYISGIGCCWQIIIIGIGICYILRLTVMTMCG